MFTAKLDSKEREGRSQLGARKMRHFDHGHGVNSHSFQGVTADVSWSTWTAALALWRLRRHIPAWG